MSDQESFENFSSLLERGQTLSAINGFESLAKTGHIPSLFKLGEIYLNDKAGFQDVEEAKKCFERAADKGNAESAFKLGFIFDNGIGKKQDFALAAKWYKRAISQGHKEAQLFLNDLEEDHLISNDNSIELINEDATEADPESADLGETYYSKGVDYFYGQNGSAKDYDLAFDNLKKAADKGHDSAENFIGYMYEEGFGRPQDFIKAAEWYKKSAAKNNRLAQQNLGSIYYYGRGHAKDFKEAFIHYENASKNGLSWAQSQLGSMYFNGYGTDKSLEKAFEWFKKSADDGNLYSINFIGLMYLNGWFVDKDLDEAKKLFSIAAGQGYDNSLKNLEKIKVMENENSMSEISENSNKNVSEATLNLALEQLRLNLLDLSGNNRLINYKHTTGKSLRFVDGSFSEIYEKLVETKSKNGLTVLGMPEPNQKELVTVNGRQQKPEPREWAKEHGWPIEIDLDKDSLSSDLKALMFEEDLAKHCRKIEREAHLALEETGANMLFLVLGFLEFRDQKDAEKVFEAPLITIPVEMSKRLVGGIQVFSLSYTGDDIEENICLREKLKNDFGYSLPNFDTEDFNVLQYLETISKSVENLKGFSVKNRISLCMLSFANMLIGIGLKPDKWPVNQSGINGLTGHPIVQGLLSGGDDAALLDSSNGDNYEVEEGLAAQIPLIYDADSSQHSALVDVLNNKKNVVIKGPPGTGKSQTITNLIAAALAEGKKVLFVAEKMAALNVVKNRLSMAGLDPFLLELHSNKANKKLVLDEISKRIEYTAKPSNDLPRFIVQLEERRKNLKAYSDLLNSIIANSMGLTIHDLIWKSEKYRLSLSTNEQKLNQYEIKDAVEISDIELIRRMDCLTHLSNHFEVIGGFDEFSAFWGFYPNPLAPGDESSIKNLLENEIEVSNKLKKDTQTLTFYIGASIAGLTIDGLKEQANTLKEFAKNTNQALPLSLVASLLEPDPSGKAAQKILNEIKKSIHNYNELREVASKAIQEDQEIDENSIKSLKSLRETASSLGVKLGNVIEIEELYKDLLHNHESLSKASLEIKRFCKSNKIIFEASIDKVAQLKNLSALFTNAPEEYFHLQRPELVLNGAAEALIALSNQVKNWSELSDQLSSNLHTDVLPSKEIINDAILTLREGDKWYRPFQGRWRKAISIHKSIQKIQSKTNAVDRLKDLENLTRLLSLEKKCRSNQGWEQYLGVTDLTDFVDLNPYVKLANWNKELQALLEELNIQSIDILNLNSGELKSLRKEFSSVTKEIRQTELALSFIENTFIKLDQFNYKNDIQKLLGKISEFAEMLAPTIEWVKLNITEKAELEQIIVSAEAQYQAQEIEESITDTEGAYEILGDFFIGVNTDIDLAIEVLSYGQSIDALNVINHFKAALRQRNPEEAAENISSLVTSIVNGLERFTKLSESLEVYGKFNLEEWVGAEITEDLELFVNALKPQLLLSVDNIGLLLDWTQYLCRKKECDELGLSEFVTLLEKNYLPFNELAETYAYCTYATIIKNIFRITPQLSIFSGLKHNQIREEFKKLDKDIIAMRGQAIARLSLGFARPLPGKNGVKVDDKTELVLLNLLRTQKKPRMPVRKILAKAGATIQELKPCFMMGPQAVAQFLTPGYIKFDLVIMDEASQLKPEQAIGAIARGAQLVVVGDPNQLPPTSFFSRADGQGNQYATADAESILDVCLSNFKTKRLLKWHYRSHHHSLIAFSNHHFYNDELIVFPSPFGQSSKLGVRAVYLADAIYDNQTNLREARRVVDEVISHILLRPDDSLGVVTLNIKQRDLIAELLDEKLASLRQAEIFKLEWAEKGEPLFVKNLENVQGDERDAIIISTTFGKSLGTSKPRQNFGPISRQGGWRRLNVLFTRAKKSVAVITSLKPEDIVLDADTPEGTKALRNYLEYARSGLVNISSPTNLDPDSDFEISVMEMLKLKGYEVVPQLGVAKFRIDIAVRHPDMQGTFLAAIECDGASYHSALSVRDRDRIRQEILESLGWKGRIWRIWSTDWFKSPSTESTKLLAFLEIIRKTWKPEHVSGESWIEEGELAEKDDINEKPSSENPDVDKEDMDLFEDEKEEINSVLVDDEDYEEVEINDTVKYVDILKPDDILTVQIVSAHEKDDITNGVISELRPLAGILLGAVVGDEVNLHLPAAVSKTFRILEIIRNA
jgi:superfamily I DNA and/or RNA helicase/TPR repeat protein/transcription elongation GreA/GreB family factor/very-short-patch-repair endonuclease